MSVLGRCLPCISRIPRQSRCQLARFNSTQSPNTGVKTAPPVPDSKAGSAQSPNSLNTGEETIPDVPNSEAGETPPNSSEPLRATLNESIRANEEDEFVDLLSRDDVGIYSLPDPVWDNTDRHFFRPTKRAPVDPKSRVLDSNWSPMFFNLDEALETGGRVPEEEEFDFDAIDNMDGIENVEETEIMSPLHHLPIPFNQLGTLHQYPLLRLRRTHQTGKGKVNSQYALVIVGNGNGLVGLGEGKADEPMQAMDNAYAQAIRHMDHVDRFEGRTLWTEMEIKFGSTKIFMRPRPVGFGLMCAPGIHQIFKAAGVKDASVKIWGSRNKVNVAKAAIMMLHAGHQPLGFGDGVGGKGRRLEKGVGMRGKTVIERERGRRILDARTW